MGFEPGQHKPVGSGRKKGTRNKLSDNLLDLLNANGLDVPAKLIELLPSLKFEKQADILMDLMGSTPSLRDIRNRVLSEGLVPSDQVKKYQNTSV